MHNYLSTGMEVDILSITIILIKFVFKKLVQEKALVKAARLVNQNSTQNKGEIKSFNKNVNQINNGILKNICLIERLNPLGAFLHAFQVAHVLDIKFIYIQFVRTIIENRFLNYIFKLFWGVSISHSIEISFHIFWPVKQECFNVLTFQCFNDTIFRFLFFDSVQGL